MTEKENSTSSGQEIPPVEKGMDQDKINAFAHFSGDFNPIHVNEEFAKKAGLGGTIAHGAISLGYFCEMLVNYFGENWLEGGGFSVSFISPVRPGYKVKYRGVITGERETDKGKVLDLEIWCENQDGVKCIVGKAYGPARL
jgi:acyl dehydratase